MRNVRWYGLLFLIFIIIFALGLSYLAFNENSAEKDDKVQKMSIALVNEDDGAEFNNEQIVFGDEFTNRVQKDDQHDWYVVSRGVAENGFDRNAYDMMIVIPNNFSEKSLAIDLQNPEPVSLHYKINATGHDFVRAEAEKTAEKILNDFNQRLIDVYFASIIGNLQDAQDNIGEIIEKEKKYTNIYNKSIQSPLADYTNQFKTVKDYTGISKDSYKNFEDTLQSFTANIVDDTKLNQSYLSDLDDVLAMQENGSLATNTFNEQFDQFIKGMGNRDILQQLDQLENENKFVQNQFQQQNNEESLSISLNALLVQNHVENMNEKIDEFEQNLHNHLDNELEKRITEGVSFAFDENNISKDVTVNELFTSLDENVKKDIENTVDKLPSLNQFDIINAGLSDKTTNDLLNVIAVTRKHSDKYETENEGKLISHRIKEIKEKLANDGFEVTDSVKLPEYDGDQYFSMSIPDDFVLEDLLLSSPSGELKSYKNEYDKNNQVKVSKLSEGNFKVKLKLKLKHKDIKIDVFEPIIWSWQVNQEGMVEKEEVDSNEPPNKDQNHKEPNPVIDEPKPGKDNGLTIDDDIDSVNESDKNNVEPEEDKENEEESSESIEEKEEEGDGEEAKEENENGNSEEPDEKEDEQSDEDEEESRDDNNGNDGSDNEDNENKLPKREKITITNNHFYQRVSSSLVENSTDEIIKATSNTIKDYYNLYSLYELYYGFDMSDVNLTEKLSGNRLQDLATEHSLYFFIHKKQIKDILKDYYLTSISNTVNSEIQDSLTAITEQVNDYKTLANQTLNDSEKLASVVSDTKEHAEEMNQNIAHVLDEVVNWREKSNELVEGQIKVLNDDEEVKTAIMSLDSSFQPLLMASESIAKQAASNFTIADHVYKTFDDIDKQAEKIQNSGVTLVNQATDLAEKLTEKSIEDADFADNFNEVLANSRVGDRQNENLYHFLSNPVQTKNDGIITDHKNETFIPYFLVVIVSALTLFTAYVISTINQKRIMENLFNKEKSLLNKNMPIALVVIIIGIVEGLIIGLVSAYLLSISLEKAFLWISLITLLTVSLLCVATYLLRQLKMVGMFILLAIFSLYLLVTESLGFKFYYSRFVEGVRSLSPLQHTEAILSSFIDGKINSPLIIILALIITSIIGFILNLIVLHPEVMEEEDEGESVTETN